MPTTLRAALVLGALVPLAVFAQAPPAPSPAAPAAPVAAPAPEAGAKPEVLTDEAAFLPVRDPGSWRVSDLRGRRVYGAEGQHIGEIKDVLVNRAGAVTAVIVGVGGFLGLGEKDVAVSMKALEFGPAVRPAPATTGATGIPGAPVPSMAAPGTTVRDDGLPDRILLRVTKVQLEKAPRFEDGRVAVREVEGSPPPPAEGGPPAQPPRP